MLRAGRNFGRFLQIICFGNKFVKKFYKNKSKFNVTHTVVLLYFYTYVLLVKSCLILYWFTGSRTKKGLWSYSAAILLPILHTALARQHIPIGQQPSICSSNPSSNFNSISSQAGIIYLNKLASSVYCYGWKKIKLFYYFQIFAVTAAESLPGFATGRERGGRAGGSYEVDAAWSNQHKLLFHILDLPGGILLKAPEPSKFSFLLLVMKKDTYNDIFSRRLVKTK